MDKIRARVEIKDPRYDFSTKVLIFGEFIFSIAVKWHYCENFGMFVILLNYIAFSLHGDFSLE